ncbi:MAG: ComF family protein [Methylophilaceae bacterium]
MNQWSKIKQFIFPQTCILCAASDGGELAICTDCLHDLPWHKAERCPQCGLTSTHHQICGACLKNPPAFDATHALFRYAFPVDAMLKRYKYQHQLVMAEALGTLMAQALMNQPQPDLIIPMPLHSQRLQQRGFNQSLEISRVIAKQLHIKLDYQSCVRTRFSAPQASLPFKERISNMRGAFACEQRFDGLHIALVDDVMTTGASLNELAKTLKQAGAGQVESWVVARTL